MILRPLAKCGLRPTRPVEAIALASRLPVWRYHEPGDEPERDIIAHGWVRETIVRQLAAFLGEPEDVVVARLTLEKAPS